MPLDCLSFPAGGPLLGRLSKVMRGLSVFQDVAGSVLGVGCDQNSDSSRQKTSALRDLTSPWGKLDTKSVK